jgi:acyl-coenzyme A thioesterase PaaI-like protein
VINRGRQIILSESEVFDVRDNGEKLVAKGMVTLMAVHSERLKQS